MAKRSNTEANRTSKRNGGAFGLEGETRMPAATMGTRAVRTSQLIQEKAREVFLAKGYFGTNIEDIADAAEVSRASFYTYFPSKRDLLLRIGQDAFDASGRMYDAMSAVAEEGGDDALERIVAMYLDLLDEHGAFLEVWGQATFQDEELRRAGLRARLVGAKRFADVLMKLGWSPGDQNPGRAVLPYELMMDRYWFYSQVAGLRADRSEVITTLAGIIRAGVERDG